MKSFWFVWQVDDFAVAGSNDEVTKSFFKEIDQCCAVVIEEEPVKMMCGVDIARRSGASS
jgi:hypothetical protein